MTTSAPAAAPDGGTDLSSPRRPGGALRKWIRNGDPIRWLGRGGAVVPVLMLAFVLVTLIIKAIPATRYSGLHFFSGTSWEFGSQYGKPVTSDGLTHLPGEEFGALPEILGTLAT